MPNHTDVRATFFGHPEDLARLRRSCRELALRPRDEMARAASWSGWFVPEPAFDLGKTPRAHLGDCGALPSTGAQAPFTLRAGIDMPASLQAVEESLHQLGSQAAELLDSNHPFQAIRLPGHLGLKSCSTRASALAWIEANDPGALRDARRLMDNEREHGATNWYDWSIKNWSTKWDAYSSSWGDAILGGRLLPVIMQTAWSPPIGALSAMSTRFGVGCAVLYIDEGGGFSDYCIIGPDGAHTEAGLPPGTSASKLAAACRRAAREGLAAMDAKAVSAKDARARSALWPHLMMAGADVTPESFGAGAPEPGSPLAASLALWACAPGNPSPGRLLSWLDELLARGVISPDTELENGYKLGQALAASGWEAGTRWAQRATDPSRRLDLARIGFLRSVNQNAPGAAVAAYEALRECGAELPDATLMGLSEAPETAAALARASSGASRIEFAQASRNGLLQLDDWCVRVGSFMPVQAAERAQSLVNTRALLEALLEAIDLDEETAPAPRARGGARRF